MQLVMLWVFGFVHRAAVPIRAASECTGVLRTCGMQLVMLLVFGFVHRAAGPLTLLYGVWSLHVW